MNDHFGTRASARIEMQNANGVPPCDKSTPKHRNSSLEFLRILCILLILANHYSVLGGIPARGWQNLTWGYFFVQSIGMFGRTACSIFVLITGYFLSAGTKPGHNRKIVPLAAEAVFYSSATFFILCALGVRTFSPKGLLLAFVPFFGGNIWFVTNYLVFWLAIPFLNPMVAALTKRQHEGLLAFFGVFWCVLPTFSSKALSFGWTFGELDFFLVMYLVGAYLRRFSPHERYRNRWNGFAALLFFTLMVLSVAGMDLLGLWLRKDALVSHAVHFLSFYSVLSVPPRRVFVLLFLSALVFEPRRRPDCQIGSWHLPSPYAAHPSRVAETLSKRPSYRRPVSPRLRENLPSVPLLPCRRPTSEGNRGENRHGLVGAVSRVISHSQTYVRS